MSGKHRPFDPECVEEKNHVDRVVLDPVAGLRLVGVAVASQRHCDGVHRRGIRSRTGG